MFQIGPMELLVLVVIGLVVIGPDKLPGLAKDAARLIRALRDMATGAQSQLRNELGDLGPEFQDLGLDDLRSLNPRVALTKMIFDDPEPARPAAPMAAPLEPDLPAVPRPGQAPLGRGEAVPIDDDAT
ncbi:sec-independent translocase [Jatrophihabitans sp. YIM 134969]